MSCVFLGLCKNISEKAHRLKENNYVKEMFYTYDSVKRCFL